MSKAELIRTIKTFHLDYRYQKWEETLFLCEMDIYSDVFCSVLLEEARLDAKSVEHEGNWLEKPPMEGELPKPDIELGVLAETGERFGINLVDRSRNCLTCGTAGSGKSTLIRKICLGIDELNQKQKVPTLLFIIDQKSDYDKDLKEKLTGETVVLSATKTLRMGLNAPENVPPYIWIGQVSLSIAGRIGIITARTVLTAIIAKLLLLLNPGLKEEDLQDGSVSKHLIWPPLETVLAVTKHTKIMEIFSAKAAYSQSLSQSLEGLLQDSGNLFQCCNGFDLNKMIEQKKHCIINASNIAPYVVHIITDLCILQTLVKRRQEGYKTDHTDLVYVLDECDLLLESDVSNFQGMSPLSLLHRLSRELGLMSIVSISGM